jgi:hypothetical protein
MITLRKIKNMKTIMSASGLFGLDKNDFLKGLIVAVLGGVLGILQKSIEAGVLTFDLKAIGHTALIAGIAYLIKNFATDNKTVIPTSTASLDVAGPGLPPGPGSGALPE